MAHPIIAFIVTVFNMIKLRVWPRLLPWVQPQRLFAAFMFTTASSTQQQQTTFVSPKKSTRESISIDSVRHYSSSTSNNNKTGNNGEKEKQVFKDSFLNESFWKFSSQGPAFAVNPSNIEFIQEPEDFYNQLIDGVKRSVKRITFASLYLGTGKHEKKLVDELLLACERNKDLQVHILLDGLRGSREGPGETPQSKVSSATMLQPLLDTYPDRVTISMYHTPDLNGLLKRVLPPRVNETIGVNHIKTYVFDNDLLMSGANLSKDYFTNRQDRYVWIYRTESIATFFNNIVHTVGTMSMRVGKTGDIDAGKLVLPHGHIDPVTESAEFKRVAEKKLISLLSPNTFYLPNSSKSVLSPFDMPSFNNNSNNSTTWIFPTIQMGPFGIRHDEVCTSYILENVPRKSRFYITSPYFNLTKLYEQLVMRGKPLLDIITCSPEANGFYGAKGLSSAVPDCYAMIEKRFLERVESRGQGSRIKVQEYIRKGWTYHAKGLWITGQDQPLPAITLIGSPNFGSRSVEKDLEAQMIVMSEDGQLQQKMENERTYLWKNSQNANLALFKQRHVSLWVRTIVSIFGNFL